MSSRRSRKKFFYSFFTLFLAYLLVVPAVYFILDAEHAIKAVQKDWWDFIKIMAGIALVISFVIAYWWKKDPALRSY